MASGGDDPEFSSISLLSDQDEDQSTSAGLTADTSFITAPNIATVLLDFKSSPVYMLEFTQKRQSGPVVSVDNEIVVRLESDEKKTAFNELMKRFNVTDGEIDVQNRVIKLTYKKTTKGITHTWRKSVLKDFREGSVSLLTWALVDLGEKAADVKPQIEQRFAPKGLICELSDDKQKLLLLSPDPSDKLLKEAAKFARNANPIAALNSEFQTTNGIKVSIFKSNITEVPADCIVSAVDQRLSLSGGVSAAIAKAAGQSMRDECRRHVEEKGTLHVSEVFASKGGKRWKNVLHVCGPVWPGGEIKSQEECCLKLTDAIFNCLKTASELGHSTLALPAVSSGSFKVPIETSAKSYNDAIERFDEFAGSNSTSLKHILFVDIVEGRIAEFQSRLQTSLRVTVDEVLRLILVGKTGVGKSMTGNSLRGQEVFESSFGLGSSTHASKMERFSHNGHTIEVVDTPGLFDRGAKEGPEDKAHAEKMVKEILRSVVLSLPGPHVFCVLFRADDRFTKIEIEVYRKIEELFDEELARYLIVVFTHSPSKGKHSIGSILSRPDLPEFVTNMLKRVDQRVIGIDNERDEEDVKRQVEQLIQMALDLRAKNKAAGKEFYTNALVGHILQLLKSGEFENKSLDDIKQEIQQNSDGPAMRKLASNPEVRDQAQKVKNAGAGCTVM